MKAAVEANNSLPNYMRAGSVGRVLNMVLPYFNPSIQGQRSWMKNFRRGDKTYKAGVAARIGAAVFLPQAAATLWNLADENRRRAYNDIRDFDKSNNMLMVLDGNETDGESRKHNVVRIKLEPGLVKASNVVRQALEAHYGNMDPVEWDDVAKGLIGMVSPVGVEGNEILSSIIPQTIKPEVQAAANYNLFRDQPIETPSMQRVLKEDRRYPWTSQTAGLIGNAVGVSPVKTEQYLYDRFGGIATQALNAADNVLAATGVIEKSQVGGVNPIQAVAERFTVARGGALEGRVYEAKAEMKRALASSYANKIKSDPEFKRLSGEDQMRAMRTAVSRANSQVEALDKHEGLAQLPIDQQVRVYEAIRADLLKSLAANN